MSFSNLVTVKRVLVLLVLFAFFVALVPPLTNAAPPPQQPGITYVVQYHDTLYSISRRFGTTVAAIMSANGLVSDYIYVGQRLIIATTPITPVGTPVPYTCKYTVVAKDTIYSIAYRYQVPWYQLMQSNFLYTPFLSVGQVLNVPCLTPEPTPFPTYTVVAGDNLFRIAFNYKTSVYALAIVNHIPNPNLVFAGQVLIVPYPNTVVWPTSIPTVTPTPIGTPAPTSTSPTATPTATTTAGAPAVVILQNIAFLPNQITIQRGSSVRWQNNDTVNHTVTSGTVGNLTGFFRANLTPGQVFTYTFTVPGTYPYFCEIHGAQMTGTVTVQ